MTKLKRALAGVIVAAVSAIGLGVSGATPVHASCTTGWNNDRALNVQYTAGANEYQLGVDVGYQWADDTVNGGCQIQYRELQVLYVWSGTAWATVAGDSGFGGNYVATRIWQCGVIPLGDSAGPTPVGGSGSGASGSTGWFYSGWIQMYNVGGNGIQCGAQIDDGNKWGTYGFTYSSTGQPYAYAKDTALGNNGVAGLTPATDGWAPYVNY